MKTRTIQARLDEHLAKRFEKVCEHLRYSESEAVREALRLWVHNAQRRKAPASIPEIQARVA